MTDQFRAYAYNPVPPGDDQRPSAPTNVVVTYDGLNVTVTCDPATDDSAVIGYLLYRDGVRTRSGSFSTTVTDLVTPGTYDYFMTAVDDIFQESLPSAVVTITVAEPPDTTKPTVPGSVLAVLGPTAGDVTVTWTASTDNRAVTGYWIVVNNAPVAPVDANTLTFTHRPPPNTYDYQVLARDAANNLSDLSAKSRVTVTGPPPPNLPPTAPTSFAVRVVGNDIVLSWGAASDPDGTIAGYLIYKDGQQYALAQLSDRSYTDVAPTVGIHTYKMRALDNKLLTGAATPTLSAQIIASYSPDGSIADDDTTDVTADLQSFFDGVPNGATINFPTGAVYHVEDPIQLSRRAGLTINFNGARFHKHDWDGATPNPDGVGRNPYRYCPALWLDRCTDVVVNDPDIVGARPIGADTNWRIGGTNVHDYVYDDNGDEVHSPTLLAPKTGLTLEDTIDFPQSGWDAYQVELEAQHGIDITGGARITINGGRITDVFGDFIDLARGRDGSIPTDITISGLYGRRNGRQGVGCAAARNLVVRGTDMDKCRRSWVDLEPNGVGDLVDGVLIEGNVTYFHQLNWLACAGKYRVDNVVIRNNRGIGSVCNVFVQPTIAGTRRSNWTVGPNNISDALAGSGVVRLLDGPGGIAGTLTDAGKVNTFTRVDGVTCTYNTQPLHKTQVLYYCDFRDSTDVTVGNNTIANEHVNTGDGQARYFNAEQTAILGTSPTYTV